MIVVADAGPLHYLILLGYVELLSEFYAGRSICRSGREASPDDVLRG
jgi:hypothetical protein